MSSVLVLRVDKDVATWARTAVQAGPSISTFYPIVIDAKQLLCVTDLEQGRAMPKLAGR